MPPLHELQQLKPSHLSLVCELAERSDPHAWSASQWASSLKQDWVLGAFDQQQLNALLVLRKGYLETELLYLLVAPELRRRGMAAMLLDQALEFSHSLQAERMLLEVRVSNQPAIDLYLSRGFVEDGCRKSYYPIYAPGGRVIQAYEDALLMGRWLILQPD